MTSLAAVPDAAGAELASDTAYLWYLGAALLAKLVGGLLIGVLV